MAFRGTPIIGRTNTALRGPLLLDRGHSAAVGLVGYWPLIADWADYTANTPPASRVGSPGDGVAPFGAALSLPGSSCLDVPVTSSSALVAQTRTAVTWSAWFNVTATSDTQRILAQPSSGTAGQEAYSLYISGGALHSVVGTPTGDIDISTPFTPAGTWHHAAGVNSAAGLILYLDGVSAATHGSSALVVWTNGNFRIGSFSSTFTQYFTGLVADVRVYSRVLPAGEIATLARSRYDILRPATRLVTYSLAAGGTGATVTPGDGTITLAGAAPTVAAGASVSPGAGSIALAGTAPTVSVASAASVSPGPGSITIAGAAPTVRTGPQLSFAAAREITELDRSLAVDGEDFIVRRIVTGSPTYVDVTCRGVIRGYGPQELTATIIQGDSKIIMSPTQISAAGWPGTSSPVGDLDTRVPRKNDKAIVQGKPRNIEAAAPIYLANVLVRIELQIRG